MADTASPMKPKDLLWRFYESAKAMSSVRSSEDLFSHATQTVAESTGSEFAVIFLPDAQDGTLRAAECFGLDADSLAVFGCAEESLSIDGEAVVRGVTKFPPSVRTILERYRIHSILSVPVANDTNVLGFLLLATRRRGYGRRSILFARAVADLTAVSLERTRLLSGLDGEVRKLEEANVRLSQQATQDGLTGLSNHRAFHQRLNEQMHRVGRYGEMFSIVMIDVDHFKAYNDAYGHQEGDFALQRIAQSITSDLRKSDFAARYGGEEFSIILPHTPKAQARVALERIRKAIDTQVFPNGKLTISAGIAECPIDGVMPNEVLEKADRALYHAKLTGRNRVCMWAAPVADHPLRAETSTEAPLVSVLVVETDQDARAALENALVQAGYEMHRASSSQEAMELLRSRKFDIMLSDALVLGTEGMQVLGLASAIHPTMPIVLTTAASMAGTAREAMRHGVTDLLVLPFNEHELPVLIERNIERKRIERQMLLQKSTGILLQAIDALVAAIDAKDRLTAGHSTRVTHLSLAIADTLGLASEDRYTLELSARLHDIGKLSLPDSALNKNGALTDEEWSVMRRHPAVGSQIVGAIEELSYVATIVRHHHERLDGKGYPDGLQGEAIPFLSRIIAVADAFEAMTSNRSFRQKMTTDEAVHELRRCVGSHYSDDIVEALVESLATGAIEDQALDDAA